jgi:hypothetical protein
LLDPKEAIKPTDDCVRIESPLDFGPRASATSTRKETPMNRIASSINQPPAPATARPAAQPMPQQPAAEPVVRRRRPNGTGKATSSLEQAIALRDHLRTALNSSKELIRCLKTEKRSQKSLKLALDSLKQLQAVA